MSKKKTAKKGRVKGSGTKIKTHVTLDKKLHEQAKELGVKLSPACEDGLARAVNKARKKAEEC